MTNMKGTVIRAAAMMAALLLFAQVWSFSRPIHRWSNGWQSSADNVQVDQIGNNVVDIDCSDRERRIQIFETHKNHTYLTEADLQFAARDAAICEPPAGLERVAFMFLVRGDLAHERLWERFFKGKEDRYSIYVHATPGFEYPEGSFFRGRQIPSKTVARFSSNLVDALRRLIAYALLDVDSPNSWFVLLCDASIPVRSFDFVYSYLTKSKLSFVESFHPSKAYHSWETLPEFPMQDLRKGEFWMALNRKHAGMVVAESTFYFKFRSQCNFWCIPDEQYIQTLLVAKDGRGIANRSVMYVDWAHAHISSPFNHDAAHITPELIQKIQSRKVDTDGARHDTAADNSTVSCVYNDLPQSECFLFARKFSSGAAQALQSLPASVLGY
ncbi:hypothetical protein O6H91_07G068600 [Diphasiastrum complanatum]|uniref:Uncharacterized protein n=1 Tax=Diphasiastrum complanatum TaxID=34168 RepID=A0ACC2D6A7_DIPCM|nr:hypothetical protein O6H91_07G068600 [Diphasiastrum complanatum]